MIWKFGEKPKGLGRPNGAYLTAFEGCSRDGKTAFGWIDMPNGDLRFVWTERDGMTVREFGELLPYGKVLSPDGSALFARTEQGPVVWTKETKLIPLSTYWKTRGLASPQCVIEEILGVSHDGLVFLASGRLGKSPKGVFWISFR